jgi:hypothetical protein
MEWAGAPLRIGALNVGFRGLMPSLQSVTQLLTELRCDILFLGDLRTAQRKIGRTRKSLEGALHEEWHLVADICHPPMRPVGIGVLLHVSLASQVQRIQPARPQEISEAEWSEAVSGRLLHLQLVRPQVKATWWIVGIYQHVAKPENKSKRGCLLQC